MTGRTKGPFKRWLSSPPRPHGDAIVDRTVSFLELFYDLVYVAVIAQAAHHLAEDVSLRGALEFGVVFAMIWIAWINGSLYVELHGRDDGRTRLLIFGQMGILALLAVFTADAAGAGGAGFAIVYAAFLALMAWHWNSVRRQDRATRPEYLQVTGYYVLGMGASVAAIGASAFLPAEPRLILWTVFSAAWILAILLADSRTQTGLNRTILPTESLVERFGLFTIIVLGEVIVGVVEGLSSVEPDAPTIATGMLALVVGFGFWWVYFDLIGNRLPRNDGTIGRWMLSHFPITLSIAASGAAMVSLIEHAHDPATPAGTAWLLGGAVAIGLVALIVAERSLADAERLAVVYRPLGFVLAAGALVALGVGWAHPAPWLLALLLVAILTWVWFFAITRLIRAGAWGDPLSETR